LAAAQCPARRRPRRSEGSTTRTRRPSSGPRGETRHSLGARRRRWKVVPAGPCGKMGNPRRNQQKGEGWRRAEPQALPSPPIRNEGRQDTPRRGTRHANGNLRCVRGRGTPEGGREGGREGGAVLRGGGWTTRRAEPTPGALSRATVPPMASARERQRARPRPVPPCRRVVLRCACGPRGRPPGVPRRDRDQGGKTETRRRGDRTDVGTQSAASTLDRLCYLVRRCAEPPNIASEAP